MAYAGAAVLRRFLLPLSFALLAYGFWLSSEFQEVAAGVAIFLFGMRFVEEGFRAFSGGLLEEALARSTGSLGRSLVTGVVATVIMQSSSLVSVITISFLSAGLIDLVAGIGIIYGANLGTTTGAWLVAGLGLKVKLSTYAMPMLVFGVILVFQKARHLWGSGYVLGGIGFLFLGIHHMKVGFEALRGGLDLAAYAMTGLAGLLVYTALGVAATVIMQSSHATRTPWPWPSAPTSAPPSPPFSGLWAPTSRVGAWPGPTCSSTSRPGRWRSPSSAPWGWRWTPPPRPSESPATTTPCAWRSSTPSSTPWAWW